MKYQVLTQRLAGLEAGQIVDADALAGCNIAALVTGGHVRPIDDEPETSHEESESE